MLTRTGIIRSLSIGLPALLLCFVAVPRARASEWDEQTWLTFSAPVEIPGHVLPAGTYDFQLANSLSNRNIVEIFNKQRTRLYAIVLGQPAYRVNPTGKTVVTFSERPVDTPEAIHKWFYPGMMYGIRFVYRHHSMERMAANGVKTGAARG
jgi:hypothetical protein